MPDVNPEEGGATLDWLVDLYRRLGPLVFARATRLVGDEAQDVVQEVFVKLLQRRPDLAQIEAWVYATSTNLCLDRLRFQRRRHRAWLADLEAHQALRASRSFEELLADREVCVKLLAAIDRKTQEVVTLLYLDQLKHQQVASLLGISVKTVAKRQQRFLARARKVWERCQR